jgi:hypothetical protein
LSAASGDSVGGLLERAPDLVAGRRQDLVALPGRAAALAQRRAHGLGDDRLEGRAVDEAHELRPALLEVVEGDDLRARGLRARGSGPGLVALQVHHFFPFPAPAPASFLPCSPWRSTFSSKIWVRRPFFFSKRGSFALRPRSP